MKKNLKLFKFKRHMKKWNFDPFSIILTLVLIVIIPKFITGDTTLESPLKKDEIARTEESNIYKDRLISLSRRIAAEPAIFRERQKEIDLILVPELFDISMSIDNEVLERSGDLVAHTEYISFGTQPTLVSYVYTITNSDGQEVFRDSGKEIIETEKIVTKEFKNLKLKGGKYSLIISTTYGDNVQDEFRQSFVVKGMSNIVRIVLIIISVTAIFVAIVIGTLKAVNYKFS